MEKDKALEMAVLQIERQYGKGSIMRLGDDSAALKVPAISTGSLGLDLALGVGGSAAWAGRRGLRPGIERQDHAGAAHDRRGAEGGRQGRVHRRRARHGLCLLPAGSGSTSTNCSCPARQRRTGPGDHRVAHPQRRPRHRGHRLGGRPDTAGRARGRDGRLLTSVFRPAS